MKLFLSFFDISDKNRSRYSLSLYFFSNFRADVQSFLKSLPIERENLWFGCKLVLHSAPDHSGGNTCEKPMYTPSMMMFSTFALPSWNARSGNRHTDDNDIASVNLPVTMLLLTYSVPPPSASRGSDRARLVHDDQLVHLIRNGRADRIVGDNDIAVRRAAALFGAVGREKRYVFVRRIARCSC